MSPSIWQIIIVLIIILIIIGPKRIPQIGKSLGEALRNFRKGLDSKSEDETKNKS